MMPVGRHQSRVDILRHVYGVLLWADFHRECSRRESVSLIMYMTIIGHPSEIAGGAFSGELLHEHRRSLHFKLVQENY